SIDIDNVIDNYLFYTLTQGTDNVSKEYVKNQYFSIHNRQGKVIAMYSPWDMDDTWGKTWRGDFPVNEQQPYTISEKYNHVMESGVVNQLIANGDGSIWEKIFDKYRYLRENGWSDENVNSLLDEYEENIFASGAYLRDMERWPEGDYTDAAVGMNTFRTFVMGRLQEFDEYFERLKGVCRDSIFIRRSAQYASFEEGSFIIEINSKELLKDSDYIDLFEYMGIDISAITEDVRFIIAKPVEAKYEYLSELGEAEGDRETCAGELSFSEIRKGLYEVSLDGTICCTSTVFSRPAIRMISVKNGMADTFDFVKGNARVYTTFFESLSGYMDGLYATKYKAVIEINNLNIWQDSSYVKLFENLGIAKEDISEKTDFIVWDGTAKEALILENFHASGSSCDTSIGTLSLYANEQGEYGVYLDGSECFVSSIGENEVERKDIRILWLDSDSGEVLENLTFVYE
ncbi:MAG: CotH kinase family protein, partial [Lachnospiraceae bacterium]|nr:CotH kinase family protein [Lachnospiraceae bacterium]